MAAAGQRLPVRRALEARAGQVVQGNGGLQTGVSPVGPSAALPRVDGDSLELVRPRSVGVEHVALWAMRQLRPPSLLEELGLSGAQRAAALFDLHQLGGAALGLVLDRGGAGPELEGPLGGEDALDAGAQRRPVPVRQGEVAAEVEQGALVHPGAAADGADEAVDEVGLLALGAGAGGGPADKHAPMGASSGTRVNKL